MSARELDAAGITDPSLRASYERCRELNAAHGKTYYLATLLLPQHKRPYVHALYGFARYADEIVDNLDSELSAHEKAQWLEDWSKSFLKGETDDQVLAAIHDTIARWQIPMAHFEAFLDSMRKDLEVTQYETFDDLMGYMYGSAAVIGLQMVPILEPAKGLEQPAGGYAQDLGIAFQLANFVRDVGEDLRRGRIYLPIEDLEHFGVTREQLRQGVVDGRVRRLLQYEIARTREIFRAAKPGVRLLHPTSRDCIRVATRLYGGILDEVERADYRVLDRKVAVPIRKRLRVAVPGLVRARAARTTPTSTASG
ncbi:MAG: 15-cis-phytoene synthase [Frankiales bacterium]|jgi:phytoene synthase|nr:15-cis-phytoene synthase [Frankiales bacterium]